MQPRCLRRAAGLPPTSALARADERDRADCGYAHTVHASFLAAYGLTAEAVPLAFYDERLGFNIQP